MKDCKTTWRKEINEVLPGGQSIIYCTLTEEELDEEFNDMSGGRNGKPFTAWSQEFVFFPIQYNGAEWAGMAPRNPVDFAMEHQGGG